MKVICLNSFTNVVPSEWRPKEITPSKKWNSQPRRPLPVFLFLLKVMNHENLTDCGVDTILYDRSIENPTDSSVRACAEFARSSEVDLIIGLGGGSSMDTAKGCNFILTNGGKMADYWGVGKASKPMLPLIAIPSTSGTGSE